MTPEQKNLVRESWANILPVKQTVADLFYARLFEQFPEVRDYFDCDMREQGTKLMDMLSMVVDSLDDLEASFTQLRESGQAHAGYGVLPEDYQKVASAFLWTLRQGLGDAYTPEVEQAWIAIYQVVARVMIEGAAEQ